MGYKVKRIMVGDKQVRPVIPPFTPGANTVAYYPFESNINDASGNNRNLSMYTGSFSYETLSSGKKVCRLNTSALAQKTSMPFSRASYTVSAWCSFNTISSTWQKMILDFLEGNNFRTRFYDFTYSGSEVLGLVSSEGNGASYVQNKWYHIVATYASNVAKMYIDGTLKFTVTYSSSGTTANLYINGTSGNNYNVNYRTAGAISELILENKTWSAAEISTYYNATRGNYGL